MLEVLSVLRMSMTLGWFLQAARSAVQGEVIKDPLCPEMCQPRAARLEPSFSKVCDGICVRLSVYLKPGSGRYGFCSGLELS